jgi:aspartate kinase
MGDTEMSQALQAERAIAVIKFGGSILTSPRAYRRAAGFVRNHRLASPHEQLVIVVSAQEGATDRLEREAAKIRPRPERAALDLLWSTGEVRSVALLVLHLHSLGISAAALNIHETGLAVSINGHGETDVRLEPQRLLAALVRHGVTVVPGFLATDSAGAIVSLGRGGSDLTAVIIARGLEARRCVLVKDVPGYFSADPHRDPAARHLPFLTFESALSLADNGCDLVQRQAIEAAARCRLPLIVRSLQESATVSCIAACEADSARLARPAFELEPAQKKKTRACAKNREFSRISGSAAELIGTGSVAR